MTRRELTPSQTIGPFFAYSLTPEDYSFSPLTGPDMAAEGTPGQRISLEGRVFDGDGSAILDAVIEIWQADHKGHYARAAQSAIGQNHDFAGFGRSETKKDGRYHFSTIKPGQVAGLQGAVQAPHVNVSIFARGLTKRLHTRIYFADEAEANAKDPVLLLVPQDRRRALIASAVPGSHVYTFDIHLQGENETVFFDT